MLSIANEKRGNVLFVKKSNKFVNVWIKDGFANKTESAMTNLHGFCKPFCSNPGNAFEHFNLFVMTLFGSIENHFWGVNNPAPSRPNWVCSMSPAKYAFVAAR